MQLNVLKNINNNRKDFVMENKTLGMILIAVLGIGFAIGFFGIEASDGFYTIFGLILGISGVWGGIRLMRK